jgi:tetratricopeptide (TPR) repeat protein
VYPDDPSERANGYRLVYGLRSLLGGEAKIDELRFELPGKRFVTVHWRDHRESSLCTALGLRRQARLFLSHAQSEFVRDTISAMANCASSYPREDAGTPPEFWIDYASLEQGKKDAFSVVRTRLIIQRIGVVATLLQPWHTPMTATRLWCNFEAGTAAQSGKRVVAALPTSERTDFIKCLKQDWNGVAKAVVKLDIRKAKASPEDTELVFKEIDPKGSGEGLSRTNQLVITALYDAITEVGVQEARQGEDLWLIGSAGHLCKQRARFEEAREMYERWLRICEGKFGRKHRETLNCIGSMAALLREQGRLAEAEPLYREALEGKRQTLGDQHPSTLIGINSLDRLLQARDRLANPA